MMYSLLEYALGTLDTKGMNMRLFAWCLGILIVPLSSYGSTLYWTQLGTNSSLYRRALDTPGAEPELVTQELIASPYYASLAIEQGRFYFRQLSGPIYSANLNGTGLGVADAVPPRVLHDVNGYALDSTNTHTYFPYPELGVIRRGDALGG